MIIMAIENLVNTGGNVMSHFLQCLSVLCKGWLVKEIINLSLQQFSNEKTSH